MSLHTLKRQSPKDLNEKHCGKRKPFVFVTLVKVIIRNCRQRQRVVHVFLCRLCRQYGVRVEHPRYDGVMLLAVHAKIRSTNDTDVGKGLNDQ